MKTADKTLASKRQTNKTEIAQIRFTKKELAYIDRQADEANLDRSKWIRRQCLNENVAIDPETVEYLQDLKQVSKQLAPIGNNVNQIARSINTAIASAMPIPEEVDADSLRELHIAITGLKQTVRDLLKAATPEHY